MGKIVDYPIDTIPALNDKVIGTDVSDGNKTKNFLVSDILDLASGGTSISIPKLLLQGFNVKNTSIGTGLYSLRDTLRAKWTGTDTAFLSLNPEIWMFNYNSYAQRKTYNGGAYSISKRNKKWKHEPHLKGIKFPNGAFYSGQVVGHFAPFVNDYGRHTEFPFSNTPDTWFNVDVDIYEWVFGKLIPTENFIKMDDYSVINNLFSGIQCRRHMVSEVFRFAIVIDNPDTQAINPKIIGVLSDEICIKYVNTLWSNTQRFIYCAKNIFVKNVGV